MTITTWHSYNYTVKKEQELENFKRLSEILAGLFNIRHGISMLFADNNFNAINIPTHVCILEPFNGVNNLVETDALEGRKIGIWLRFPSYHFLVILEYRGPPCVLECQPERRDWTNYFNHPNGTLSIARIYLPVPYRIISPGLTIYSSKYVLYIPMNVFVAFGFSY